MLSLLVPAVFQRMTGPEDWGTGQSWPKLEWYVCTYLHQALIDKVGTMGPAVYPAKQPQFFKDLESEFESSARKLSTFDDIDFSAAKETIIGRKTIARHQ